ncbi:hypothetical protein C8Q74DRAFT_1250135 [Fomes fomentarius]|nr:hypothetical protein C8Q74DRAFT_1250135 [Fomes fomentarius]
MSLPFLRQLAQLFLPCRLFVLHLFVLFFLPSAVRGIRNITLEDTASQITYSPPACGLTLTSAGTEICNSNSSWRILTSPNASEGTITTTIGPSNASGGFIPQLFLTVRALSLDLRTAPGSNATVNISVSTSNPVVSVTAQVNSSVQPIRIVGLVEDRLTTLALTFEESNSSTFLGIDDILVTISDNNTAPFILPSPPTSTSLPPATPSIVIPSQTPERHGQSSGDIAAEVLGAILGAVLIGAGAFLALWLYRRRKRRATKATDSENQNQTQDLQRTVVS